MRVHAQLSTGIIRGWDVCALAVVVQGMGDLVAQQAIEGRGWEHDWHRTARIAMFGFAISVGWGRTTPMSLQCRNLTDQCTDRRQN